MAQLTKGMYGSEFRRENNLFGLGCGQMRANDMVHNGGWYNRSGEKLGWGDLSPEDFKRISEGLEEGELFIILYESDSYWRHVTFIPGPIGSMAKTAPTEEAPGVEFVSDKCAYVIGKGSLKYVDPYGDATSKSTDIFGLAFEVVSREEAKRLIAGTAGFVHEAPAKVQ